jgi:hypothetical protein
MSYAADPVKRAAILDAEQKRLDWLRDNPAIPVMFLGNEQVYVASAEEVTAIAALTVTEPQELNSGLRVTVRFGAGVAYVAVAAEQAQSPAVAA